MTEAFEQLEPWLTVKTGESEAELDSAEINRVLNSFLRKQTLEARTLFLRRYWYGEGIFRELAKACHMSESMVKSSLVPYLETSFVKNWKRKGYRNETESF